MFLNLLNIIKGMLFFTGSYSNSVFPEPLSSEEEEICINKMLNGDKEARNKLIEHNLRLVAHIVKKYDTKEAMTDDLISIGTIGLIKGIDTYNGDIKTKITTYAARCIQNEILMHFRSQKKYGPTVSLNDAIGHDKEGNEINLIDVIKDKNVDLFETLDLNNTKDMTQKEIADELKISRSYVSRIEKRALTKMLTEFIKNKNID